MVIKRQSLPNFACGVSNHRVSICVVVRRPVEDLHPKASLLKLIRLTGERVLHNELQQCRVTLAVAKMRASAHRKTESYFLPDVIGNTFGTEATAP
jgi:hypothetical protein